MIFFIHKFNSIFKLCNLIAKNVCFAKQRSGNTSWWWINSDVLVWPRKPQNVSVNLTLSESWIRNSDFQHGARVHFGCTLTVQRQALHSGDELIVLLVTPCSQERKQIQIGGMHTHHSTEPTTGVPYLSSCWRLHFHIFILHNFAYLLFLWTFRAFWREIWLAD